MIGRRRQKPAAAPPETRPLTARAARILYDTPLFALGSTASCNRFIPAPPTPQIEQDAREASPRRPDSARVRPPYACSTYRAAFGSTYHEGASSVSRLLREKQRRIDLRRSQLDSHIFETTLSLAEAARTRELMSDFERRVVPQTTDPPPHLHGPSPMKPRADGTGVGGPAALLPNPPVKRLDPLERALLLARHDLGMLQKHVTGRHGIAPRV